MSSTILVIGIKATKKFLHIFAIGNLTECFGAVWYIIQGGPERSSQTLRFCRKFNSEQKVSYKHGSKNVS